MLRARNKVTQTIDLFRQITHPLKSFFNLAFGYMIVFKDNYYYTIIDNAKFLNIFVSEIKKSSIFSGKDITSFFDNNYRFNLWPQIPSSQAMEICLHHNLWNGITISKLQEGFTELWWFTGDSNKVQDFFLRNKGTLLKFIDHFNYHKPQLSIPTIELKDDLFRFSEGFDINIKHEDEAEVQNIKSFLDTIRTKSIVLSTKKGQVKLSQREIEILSLTAAGLTAKLAANRMNISTRTARHYIENIKFKIDIHQKSNLIGFYFDHLQKLIE